MGPSCYIEYRGIRIRTIRGFYCTCKGMIIGNKDSNVHVQHKVWLNWVLTPWDMKKKIWNTLLTHVAPKQDCSDQQASKLLLISHWPERPKGCADTAVTWCHSRLSRWQPLWLSRWPFFYRMVQYIFRLAIMRFWRFKLSVLPKVFWAPVLRTSGSWNLPVRMEGSLVWNFNNYYVLLIHVFDGCSNRFDLCDHFNLVCCCLSPVLISDKRSCWKISQSLKPKWLDVEMLVPLF